MTPSEGLSLAAMGALGVFVLGVIVCVLWRVEARQARRRRAPRFEAPREQVTQELPIVACPGCGRNAGHDADCSRLGRLGLAATAIDIPRTGQGEQ